MHSPVDLHELLAQVRDEPSCIRFIEALGVDFASGRLIEKTSPSSAYGPSSPSWENVSVDAFFDAAASWGCPWEWGGIQCLAALCGHFAGWEVL